MKRYFKFNKSQKVGIISLGLITLTLVYFLNTPNHNFVKGVFVNDTTQLEYFHITEDLIAVTNSEPNKPKSKLTIVYEKFNPNSYDKSDWMAIGFSKKQAEVILKFKASTGGFKSVNDLKKVYVISEKKLIELSPYLIFPEKLVEDTDEKEVIELVELNLASKSDLIKIKGIGEVLADRIINFREKLGGFYSKDQLKDVYGLSSENFDRMDQYLIIDQTKILKLNIRTSSFNRLKSHPYVTWDIAKSIIKTREKDAIKSLDFLKVEGVSEKEIKNVEPYINFE